MVEAYQFLQIHVHLGDKLCKALKVRIKILNNYFIHVCSVIGGQCRSFKMEINMVILFLRKKLLNGQEHSVHVVVF